MCSIYVYILIICFTYHITHTHTHTHLESERTVILHTCELFWVHRADYNPIKLGKSRERAPVWLSGAYTVAKFP